MWNGIKYILVLVFPLSLLWGQVKIGEHIDVLNPAAILELESTTQGLLLPRLTTAQRDSIPIHENTEGLLIFNVNSNTIQYLKREADTTTNNKQPSYSWESAQDDRIRFAQTSHPEAGQLFFDALEMTLYLWNGTAWIPIGGAHSHTVTPTPAGPCGPIAPGGPCAPGRPCGPCGPCAPERPCNPGGPCTPAGPCGPVSP